MKSLFKWGLLGIMAVALLGSCTGNKKNRCNTCPKWEDSINTMKMDAYEK